MSRAGLVCISADCSYFVFIWMSGSLGEHYASFSAFKDYVHVGGRSIIQTRNMSLIKISFISLLIKRLSLIIEFAAPPPWALRFIFVLSVLSVTPLWL